MLEDQPIKKHKIKKRKLIKWFSLTSIACVILVSGFFGINIWRNINKILRGGSGEGALALNKNIDPVKLKGEGDGRVNILLLGKGGGDHNGADLTDSIIIASIDPIAKDAVLLSIPRDLYVKVSGFWSMKINAAYSYSREKSLSNNKNINEAEKVGTDTTSKVLQEVTGIPIHYHVVVNFAAFKQAVDAVGGVTVDVKEPLYDYVQSWENDNNPLLADAGVQTFNGQRALLYARSRYSSSDFARGERQRQIIIGLKDKVLQMGTFSNPIAVTKLIDAIGNNVYTDLSLNEIMRLYELGKDTPSSSLTSIGFTDEPNVLVKTDNFGDQSVVVPRKGTYDYSEIRSFVRNNLRDSFLRSEDAKVVILNGSGISGEANSRAEELKSYGYNVLKVDNAPTQNYTEDRLIDFSNGSKKYTLSYLEKRIGVKASSAPAEVDNAIYGADIVIIIGKKKYENNTTN